MLIFQDEALRIEKLVLGPYETNAYILVCLNTQESLVVDAPANVSAIIGSLKNTEPKYLLLTHDHYDHTGVIVSLRERLKVPLATHKFNSFQLKKPPEILLNDGDNITLGALKLKALYTPGHTPGHCLFYCVQANVLFSGDLIFQGGVGRTDLPGGDWEALLRSIREQVFTLPDETRILPGHGEETRVGEEKCENPFVRA